MRSFTHRRTVRLLATAGVLTAVAAWILAGCSGGDGQSAVFENAPGGFYTYNVNVAEPADFVLYFVNTSGEPVHLTRISVAAASKSMRMIGTSVYDERRVGSAPATALGILPKECPKNYAPSPATSLTVPAHSGTPWFGVVTVSFQKPGRYVINQFRIDYTTPNGPGWQDLVDPIHLTVREPARPGPTPEPGQCSF